MSVTLKRNPVRYVYTVDGTVLEKVDTMRDLGVLLEFRQQTVLQRTRRFHRF